MLQNKFLSLILLACFLFPPQARRESVYHLAPETSTASITIPYEFSDHFVLGLVKALSAAQRNGALGDSESSFFKKKLKNISIEEGFALPQQLDFQTFRQFKKGGLGATFVYQLSINGKAYILIVGNKEKLNKAIKDGVLPADDKTEKNIFSAPNQIKVYSYSLFQQHKDWVYYFRYRIGTAIIQGKKELKSAPRVVFKNRSLDRNSDVSKEPLGTLKDELKDLFQYLIEASDLRLRTYLRNPSLRVFQKSISSQTDSRTKDQYLLEINFIPLFRLQKSQGHDTQINLPKALIDPDTKGINTYEKKIASRFLSRYALRQMMAQQLYGTKNEVVTQTLVLLDWIQDFVTLSAQDQYFLSGVLPKLLPKEQHFILRLMQDIAKERHPKLTRDKVVQVLRFVEKEVLRQRPKTDKARRIEPARGKRPKTSKFRRPATGGHKRQPPPKTGSFSRLNHPLLDETWHKWVEIDGADFDIWRFFNTVPNLSPKLKLEYLAISLSKYDVLSEDLKGFLTHLSRIQNLEPENINQAFVAATVLLDELLTKARLRQQNYLNLRKIIFSAIYQRVLEVEPTQDQYPSHFFFKKLLQHYSVKPSKEISSSHMVAHFFDEAMDYIGYLKSKADAEKGLGPQREAYRRVLRFVGGVKQGLISFRRLDFPSYFIEAIESKQASLEQEIEQLEKRLEAYEEDSPLLNEFADYLIRLEKAVKRKDREEKIVKEARFDSDFDYSLFEEIYKDSTFEEILSFFQVDPNSGRGIGLLKGEKLAHIAKLVKFLNRDQTLVVKLLRFYGEMSKKGKLPGFTEFLEITVQKSFSDEVAKILTSAALMQVKTDSESEAGFQKEHFFQMFLYVSKNLRVSFAETELYQFLKQSLHKRGVSPEFNLALSKFKKKAPDIKELNVDSRETIPKLFDWYLKILTFVNIADLEPHPIKGQLEETLKKKVQNRLIEIERRANQSGLRRKATSWLRRAPSFTLEFETIVEKPFLEGLNHLVARNYVQGVEELQKVLRIILKEYKQEYQKYVDENISGRELTAEKEFSLLNQFYALDQNQMMRQIFESALFSLKYVQTQIEKGDDWHFKVKDAVLQNERLNFQQKEELDHFLGRKSVGDFLKGSLPRIETIQIKGVSKVVRVYPFLDFGEGGKEGQFQYLQYAFFGSRIYDYLGYSVVEIGEEGKEGFQPKKYVAKLAQTPYVKELYLKYLPNYFTDMQENVERFQNNHYKEKLVNEIIQKFKKYLLDKANSLEDEKRHDEATELREYARLLVVPSLTFTDDISLNKDADKEIQLLLIEFLPDLFEVNIPKTTFSLDADASEQLTLNQSSHDFVVRVLNMIQGKMAAQVQKRGFFEESPQKLAYKRLQKLKALSVLLNTVLRNVDYGPFISKTALAILDMEASFPHFFSSKFNTDIKEGDWFKVEQGYKLNVQKGPHAPEEIEKLKSIGFHPFDPKKPASFHFTWRLNNVFVSQRDRYAETYQPLVMEMAEFLRDLELKLDVLPESEQIIAYLNQVGAEQLENEVKALIQGDGVALLNLRGEVVPYLAPIKTEQTLLQDDATLNGDMTAAVMDDLHDYTQTMKFSKPGDQGIETITLDPLSPEAQNTFESMIEGIWEEQDQETVELNRPKSDRLTQKSSLDHFFTPEAFVEKTRSLSVKAEVSIKTQILEINSKMHSDKLSGSRLLFGEINEDVFEIKMIKIPPSDSDRLLKFIAEVEEETQLSYLGRWFFHKPKDKKEFKITDYILRSLSSKKSRERLLVMVSDYRLGLAVPTVAVYGIPSEGIGNEALTKALLADHEPILLPSPLRSSARTEKVAPSHRLEVSL